MSAATLSRIAKAIVPVVVALAYGSAGAQSSGESVPPYAPYEGSSGYQEFEIANDQWYVAFHGTREHTVRIVTAGWTARAAELCLQRGRRYLVELNYVDEPVHVGDPAAGADDNAWRRDRLRSVRGFVYVPIFVPSGPRMIPDNLTPSKMAAVRCVDDVGALKPGREAVPVMEAIAKAKAAGLAVPQASLP